MGRRTRIEQDDLGQVVRRPRSAASESRPRSPRRTSMAFAIFIAVALAAAIALVLSLHNGGTGSALRPAHARRIVVFVIDGASNLPLSSMPAVARLARDGTVYDRAWIGQWPSVRPASGATIGTGVFPRAHGVAGASWRDPTTGREIQPTLPANVRLGSLDQILESRRLTPIASVLKDRNPQARVLAVGGVGCAPADAAGSWLADYVLCIARKGNTWVQSAVTGHDLPASVSPPAPVPAITGQGLGPRLEGQRLGGQDDQIAEDAINAIPATRPALTVVEFPEPVAVGAYAPAGQRDAVIGTLLAGIDADINRIESALRADHLLAGTAFVVTSGEALSPLQHTEAVSSFSDAVITAGGVPVFVHGSGAVDIALQDPTGAQAVAQAIEQSRLNGIDAIFYRSQQGSSWQFQPQYLDPLLKPGFGDALSTLLSTAAAAEAPDVVAVYAPYTGAPDSAGSLKATSVSGGLSWDTQHIPLILSGPGVIGGQTSHFPARLVDLAPTIEALLGLNPAASDGIVLADAFMQPPNGDTDAQQRRAASLDPLVKALIDRLNSVG